MGDYNPLEEFGVQAAGSAVQTCGPHTGHVVRAIAYCDGEDTARHLVRLSGKRQAILTLIGNVDHSKGNGANSAEMRGQLLNDIRDLLNA